MMSHRLTAFVAIAALTGAAACSRTEPEQPAAPVEPAAAPASVSYTHLTLPTNREV